MLTVKNSHIEIIKENQHPLQLQPIINIKATIVKSYNIMYNHVLYVHYILYIKSLYIIFNVYLFHITSYIYTKFIFVSSGLYYTLCSVICFFFYITISLSIFQSPHMFIYSILKMTI